MNETDIVFGDTIDVSGLDTIVKFSQYKSGKPDLFLDGIELADDLTAKSGTLLYAKDTKISHMHIARLLRVQESKPDTVLSFKIK